ncbi:Tat protein secretion system quality control protein TatD with DNase activity [Deinococcus metallilatus]|uniref:Tat protein secretion system quality control protein TatD with DNase activity n=2 Tax=Deinococcus metallilatus TaxID=1211322 RepID=A0ABR6MV52_9DEIO|nr:Tat protein secretion system quality control protein TatD with DNase activity [Deinococcus metallilatus]
MTSYVGEVGLDGSGHGRAFLELQRASFEFVLEALGRRTHLMSIHSRGAEAEVLDRLSAHGVQRAVFHWYTGPLRLVDAILSAGHAFSVNPAMMRSASGRRIIAQIPADRLLTESDGPHIRLEGQAQDPRAIPALVAELAPTLGLTPEELAEQIFHTLKALLSPTKGEEAPFRKGHL